MIDDYAQRLGRALAYIDRNLGRKLTLEEIAGVGAFSPYHFHRVFKASIGETLHAYILRRRISLAASCLRHRVDWNLTRVAMECGFASPSDFSRAFKQAMGTSPRRFRAEGAKADQAAALEPDDLPLPARAYAAHARADLDARIEVAHLADERLAYITCIGVSMRMDTPAILAAFKRLYRWSTVLGMRPGSARFLGLVSEDPAITPVERIRYTAALALPDGLEPESSLPRGVGADVFPLAGAYVAFALDRSSPAFARDYLEAIDYLFKEWMPANSLAPDRRPIVEAYSPGPGGRSLVRVHVPCLAT